MLEVSRDSQYYKPKGESQANIDIMKKMDKYSLDHPTSVFSTMVSFQAMDRIVVNHKRISRLMKVMRNLKRASKISYLLSIDNDLGEN